MVCPNRVPETVDGVCVILSSSSSLWTSLWAFSLECLLSGSSWSYSHFIVSMNTVKGILNVQPFGWKEGGRMKNIKIALCNSLFIVLAHHYSTCSSRIISLVMSVIWSHCHDSHKLRKSITRSVKYSFISSVRHSTIHSLIHHSLIYMLTHLLAPSFICILINSSMLLLSHWLINSVTHSVNCWFISTVISPSSQLFSHTFLEFNALSFIDSLTDLFILFTHLIIQWLNHSFIYISVHSCILLFIHFSHFLTGSFIHRFNYTIMDV